MTKRAKKPSAGARIIASLKDAIAGKFAAVTIDGQQWVRVGFIQPTKYGAPAGWGAAACCPMVERSNLTPDLITESCEGCSKTIKEGDLYFSCEDGPYLCSKCSPTYGDAEEQMGRDAAIGEDDDMRDARLHFMKALDSHLAAGGSRADKLPLCKL